MPSATESLTQDNGPISTFGPPGIESEKALPTESTGNWSVKSSSGAIPFS